MARPAHRRAREDPSGRSSGLHRRHIPRTANLPDLDTLDGCPRSWQPGALSLYQAVPNEHLSFVKRLTAKVKTEEFLAGKGLVTKWERLRRNNHWLDALYNACAAGHLAGVRLIDSPATVPQPKRKYGSLSELQAAKRLEQGFDTRRWDEMMQRWRM